MTKTQENIETALRLLDANPQGLHYAELIRKIEAALPGMSRNTISGSIWDLDQTHQDKVYKVSKGIFRLLKYQSSVAPAQSPAPQVASARQIREEDFYQPFADWLVNEVEECSAAIALGGNRFKDKWQTPDDPDFTIQTRPVRSLPDMFYTNKYMKLIEKELF